ncbi:hypothetical protein RHGRI_023898 [Rhododendron griersonianum]|uniref:Uncharacterized protein n=1 Tax=Rhododendron griersonianum TaxID=479676 RepID=A0AAV6J7B0_9ERIC|nr:hypothetical protein RHGRI_023898 [Rhododendron griersonianum]
MSSRPQLINSAPRLRFIPFVHCPPGPRSSLSLSLSFSSPLLSSSLEYQIPITLNPFLPTRTAPHLLPHLLPLNPFLRHRRKPRPHLRRRGHPQRRGEADGGLRSDGGECLDLRVLAGGSRGLRCEGVEECRLGGSCETGVGSGGFEAEEKLTGDYGLTVANASI